MTDRPEPNALSYSLQRPWGIGAVCVSIITSSLLAQLTEASVLILNTLLFFLATKLGVFITFVSCWQVLRDRMPGSQLD